MPAFVDRTGCRYGRLSVQYRDTSQPSIGARWICLCDCGKTISVRSSALQTGNTKSCGCLRIDAVIQTHTTHGHAKKSGESRVYMIWTKMIGRCHSPTNKDYQYYGARGIAVCERWRESFEAFLEDMGEPAAGMSLERDENDLGYSPSNCRWATRREQSNNTSWNVIVKTADRSMTMAQFAELVGLPYGNIRSKIRRGVRLINGIQIEVFWKGKPYEHRSKSTGNRRAAATTDHHRTSQVR